MHVRHTAAPDDVRGMSTDQLRERFLVERLTDGSAVTLVHATSDRIVVGGVRPDPGARVLLPNPDQLRSAFFLERRELGIVNIGTPGTVEVDGVAHPLGARECLYVGRGSVEVAFLGAGAAFYLVSTRAHATYPTVRAGLADAEPVRLGSTAGSNERTIYKYIHAGGIRSCELVLGVTVLEQGSMWNTMPCHTHDRRTEVYYYFDLPDEHRIVHLMGRPDETRNLIVANEQAVVSPPWSVHCGFGTSCYSFVWAMGGENQAYDDLEVVAVREMR